MCVNGEPSESFSVKVGVRQGCVLLPRLFNIYKDGCIREMQVTAGDLDARMNVRGVEQPLVSDYWQLHMNNTMELSGTVEIHIRA